MKHKALDRAGRKLTIVTWFAIRIQHNNMTYATSYEVARGLGLTASGKLRAILREMVDDGTLQAVEMAKQGRWKGSGFMLAEGTYSRPRRTIQLNRNGKHLDQMEMF